MLFPTEKSPHRKLATPYIYCHSVATLLILPSCVSLSCVVPLICDLRRTKEKKSIVYTKLKQQNMGNQNTIQGRGLFVFILERNWVIQYPNTS